MTRGGGGADDLEVVGADRRREFDRALARCFPGWGGAAATRWYLDRGVGRGPADRLALAVDGRLAAGCGLNYRSLALASGAVAEVALISSAWTLPEARGRGLYHRLLAGTVAHAGRRGRPLVVAFMTADNPSARGWARLGGELVPAAYLVSPPWAAGPPAEPPGERRITPVEPTDRALSRLRDLAGRRAAGRCRIVYPDLRGFRSQLVARPLPADLLRVGEGGWAVVERAAGTDRVLLAVSEGSDLAVEAVFAALLGRARAAGRGLFAYSTEPPLVAALTRLGMAVKPGVFGLLGAGAASAARHGRWHLTAGDRM